MKKLYHVTIEYEVYALGEDEADAVYNAKDGIKDEYLDPDWEHAEEILLTEKNAKTIDGDWIKTPPFGNEDDKTIEEIFAEANDRSAETMPKSPDGPDVI